MKRILISLLLVLSMIGVSTSAFSAGNLSYPKFKAFKTGTGSPCVGCKLYVYTPGTTTKKNSYTDSTAATANANPVILDSNGEAPIWYTGTARLMLYSSADVLMWDIDNIGYGSVDFGSYSASQFTTLALADAAAVADGKSLIIDRDFAISSSTTIGSHVIFVDGGSLTESGASASVSFTHQPTVLTDGQIFIGWEASDIIGLSLAKPEWFGASEDSGTTDNYTYFEMAAAAAPKVIITRKSASGYYKITDKVDISAAVEIIGEGLPEIRQATSNKGGFAIAASNVTIKGIKLRGPQHASAQTGEKAIYASGADASHYISGVNVEDCELHNWGYGGIQGKYVEDFKWHKNRIYDIYQAGIETLSCKNGSITLNRGTGPDSPVGGGVYGIAITRITTNDAVTPTVDPRSSDITVAYNDWDGVTNWEALDTHGGERIRFIGNTVKNSYNGIAIGPSKNSAGTAAFAPLECVAIGNTIESGVTDGTASAGIGFQGAYNGGVIQKATGSIIGNTIKGHGLQDQATGQGGIFLNTTQGVAVNSNTIIEASPHGIIFNGENYGFACKGNTIIDPWSEDVATPSFINTYSDNNTGLIAGNSLSKAAKTATYVGIRGIRRETSTSSYLTIGQNYSEATTYLSSTLAYIKPDVHGGRITVKQTVTHADFTSGAAPTKDVFGSDIPAGAIVTDVWWSLGEEFAGGSISAATLEFGPAGVDADGWISAENVFTGAGTGYKDTALSDRGQLLYNSVPLQYFCTAARTPRLVLRLTGDTADHLTTGEATIWLTYMRLN